MLNELWTAAQQIRLVQSWSVHCEDTTGVSVQALPDLDGDGVSEVGISYQESKLKEAALGFKRPGDRPTDWDIRGIVRIVSGRTGETWKQFVDTECGLDGGSFGGALAVLPRPAAEGAPWLLIGHGMAGNRCGGVTCLDPATGLVRYTLPGPERLDGFGSKIVVMGDLDGDGQDDMAVASSGLTGVEGQHESDCAFSLISGASGALIRRFSPDPSCNRPLLFRVEDITADGLPELGIVLTVDGNLEREIPLRPRLIVMDPAKDKVLVDLVVGASREGSAGDEAWAVSSEADLDGDGRRDILLGVPFPNLPRAGEWHAAGGTLHAIDGLTGRELRTLGGGGEVRDNFGMQLAALGDWNADGIDEWAVSGGPSPPFSAKLALIDGATGAELGVLSDASGSLSNSSIASVRTGAAVSGLATVWRQRPPPAKQQLSAGSSDVKMYTLIAE